MLAFYEHGSADLQDFVKSYCIVFNAHVSKHLIPASTYPMVVAMERLWNDHKAVLTKGKRLPWGVPEVMAQLERLAQLGVSGNLRSIAPRLMKALGIPDSLAETGYPCFYQGVKMARARTMQTMVVDVKAFPRDEDGRLCLSSISAISHHFGSEVAQVSFNGMPPRQSVDSSTFRFSGGTQRSSRCSRGILP